MKKTIIYEDKTAEEANLLASKLNCELINVNSVEGGTDFDLLILLFVTNKGQCSLNIEKVLLSIKCNYIALIARGKTGFDINRMLINIVKKQGTVPVYSKYYADFDDEEIAKEIESKYIRMDGFSTSEMIVGKLSRLFTNSRDKL